MTAALPGPAWLFCPGDRPDRYHKAADQADLVIIDLEDAVATTNKEAARQALLAERLDPARVIVRVSSATSPDHDLDLAALSKTDYRTVMLAKAEDPGQLRALADWQVIALIETPLGVQNVAAVAAAPEVVGLMWGAEDLIAAMGGRSSRWPDGGYRDVARHARSAVAIAAHAYGRHAVDSVYLDIRDLEGLAAEAADGAASGFGYKACIHPSQAAVVREAFRPTAAMLDWARRVIAAAQTSGVLSLDGQMIDAPLIRQAERIVAADHER
ncbi:MAG: CoA ester lyase [Frankiales bacterium]|nr:CoA ester lyase [Frankiales bacterium]